MKHTNISKNAKPYSHTHKAFDPQYGIKAFIKENNFVWVNQWSHWLSVSHLQTISIAFRKKSLEI